MAEVQAVCHNCGEGDNLWAWYPVEERQSIAVEINELGQVAYDYTGITASGEAGADLEFYCSNCQNSAPTIEELVGAPAIPKPEYPTLLIGKAPVAPESCSFEHGNFSITIGTRIALPADVESEEEVIRTLKGILKWVAADYPAVSFGVEIKPNE